MRIESLMFHGSERPQFDHGGNWVYWHRIRSNPTAFRMSYWQGATKCEIDYLQARPELGKKLLDFGCGSGHLDVLLARTGRSILGMDTSHIGINLANNLRFKQDLDIQQRLQFVRGDITSQEIQTALLREDINFVWSTHVFEHISDPSNIFIALKQSVKISTPMLIVVPLGYAYDDPDHFHHWHSEEQLYRHLQQYTAVQSVEADEANQVLRAYCIL